MAAEDVRLGLEMLQIPYPDAALLLDRYQISEVTGSVTADF